MKFLLLLYQTWNRKPLAVLALFECGPAHQRTKQPSGIGIIFTLHTALLGDNNLHPPSTSRGTIPRPMDPLSRSGGSLSCKAFSLPPCVQDT